MPKPVSIIDNLPEADREQVLSWLESHPTSVVVEMIAKPQPDGYGVRTHVTTLRRFYARCQADANACDLEIANILETNDGGRTLENATEALLRKWAFHIASNPHRTTNAFRTLSSWVQRSKEQKQRELQLALNQHKLALDREKFEFSAAEQALLYHARLGQISENSVLTNDQKISAAREQLFGKPPRACY